MILHIIVPENFLNKIYIIIYYNFLEQIFYYKLKVEFIFNRS